MFNKWQSTIPSVPPWMGIGTMTVVASIFLLKLQFLFIPLCRQVCGTAPAICTCPVYVVRAEVGINLQSRFTVPVPIPLGGRRIQMLIGFSWIGRESEWLVPAVVLLRDGMV